MLYSYNCNCLGAILTESGGIERQRASSGPYLRSSHGSPGDRRSSGTRAGRPYPRWRITHERPPYSRRTGLSREAVGEAGGFMPGGNRSGMELLAAAIATGAARRYNCRLCQLGNIRYRSLNRRGWGLRERPRGNVAPPFMGGADSRGTSPGATRLRIVKRERQT